MVLSYQKDIHAIVRFHITLPIGGLVKVTRSFIVEPLTETRTETSTDIIQTIYFLKNENEWGSLCISAAIIGQFDGGILKLRTDLSAHCLKYLSNK